MIKMHMEPGRSGGISPCRAARGAVPGQFWGVCLNRQTLRAQTLHVHSVRDCVLKTDTAGVIAIQPSGTHRLSPQNLSMLGQAVALVSADVVEIPQPQTFSAGVSTFDC